METRRKTRYDRLLSFVLTEGSEPGAMFLQNAAIHHHADSCIARLLCCSVVNHTFLQPERWNFQTNCLCDDLRDKLRTTKDIDHVDLLRNLGQTGISLLSQNGSFVWIDGNNAISLFLHVLGNTEARPEWAGRETDYGNGFCACEQFSDCVILIGRHTLSPVTCSP